MELDATERALSSGDTQIATPLHEPQKELLGGARGRNPPDIAYDALANSDRLARSYQLKLLFSVAPR